MTATPARTASDRRRIRTIDLRPGLPTRVDRDRRRVCRAAGSPARSATTSGSMGSATRCHFVNPKYDELLGQACYPSLDALPERPTSRSSPSTRCAPPT